VGRLTKKKINLVIRSVSRWKGLAELYQTEGTIGKIENMENDLKHLMEGLGVEIKVDRAAAPGKNLHNFESICH
jgi:hypothetical protein